MQAQQDRLQQAETSLKRRLNEEENAAKKAHSWKSKVGRGRDQLTHFCAAYTARNATDLMQVVDFTGLMQVANKLYQVREHQSCCNLIFADLLQKLMKQLASSLHAVHNLQQVC